MARRRLTPAQPGYLVPLPDPAPDPATGPAPGAGAGPLPAGNVPPIAKVSGQSAEAAALRELAEGIAAARREGRMIVEVPLADIAPGHLVRDRIVLEREALEALKASIRRHGQRVPAELAPLDGTAGTDSGAGRAPHRFGLISGWRRLRAVSELHDETGEARFATLKALIRPGAEGAGAYIAMVEENEIRVGLSYYERARLVAEATRRGAFVDQSAALRQIFATASRAKRSKIASFIDLHEALGDVLGFPAEIPERLGLALVARLRLGEGGRIRAALAAARPAEAAAELALLERLARPKRSGVSRAKQRGGAEILRDGISMKAARQGRKITLTLSGAGIDDALLERVRQALRQL